MFNIIFQPLVSLYLEGGEAEESVQVSSSNAKLNLFFKLYFNGGKDIIRGSFQKCKKQ
jgi:hypothetical protein